MKRKLLCSALFVSMAFAGIAQKDSSRSTKRDTIRVGNILIIKKGKGSDNDSVNITLGRRSPSYPSYNRTTTNWGVFDIGFSNYTDKTDYGNTGSFLVNKPGSPNFSSSDFKLRTGKSINVNIWFFMQTLHLVKNNVNIKYGFGLELNNYRYKSSISYREDGTLPYSGGLQTNAPFIFRDSIFFSKNKLAADYLTIPFMINFASNKYSINKGISVSFGVSAGYLYSQRNKQKSDERGKKRNKGDYDMERFKLSYIAELGLGPVKFYGSYSPKSMYEHSLDMRPYTIGIRFSN